MLRPFYALRFKLMSMIKLMSMRTSSNRVPSRRTGRGGRVVTRRLHADGSCSQHRSCANRVPDFALYEMATRRNGVSAWQFRFGRMSSWTTIRVKKFNLRRVTFITVPSGNSRIQLPQPFETRKNVIVRTVFVGFRLLTPARRVFAFGAEFAPTMIRAIQAIELIYESRSRTSRSGS